MQPGAAAASESIYSMSLYAVCIIFISYLFISIFVAFNWISIARADAQEVISLSMYTFLHFIQEIALFVPSYFTFFLPHIKRMRNAHPSNVHNAIAH